MKIIFLFVCLLFSKDLFAGEYVKPTQLEVTEAIETFKFRGQWIHPKIVEEFLPWNSDYNYPLITAIDIGAAIGTNRFFGNITIKGKTVSNSNEEEFISYEWLGRLKNGFHILSVSRSSGATMVEKYLVALSLKEKSAKNESAKEYNRLLIEIERVIVLGDRGVATFKIKEKTVDIEVKCDKSCESKNITAEF